jgi:hypothetical protein
LRRRAAEEDVAVSDPPIQPSADELIASADPAVARRTLTGVAVRTPTIACDDLT